MDGEGKFRKDAWTREDGGGGISCVMADGKASRGAREREGEGGEGGR